jgi:hypothetical protein
VTILTISNQSPIVPFSISGIFDGTSCHSQGSQLHCEYFRRQASAVNLPFKLEGAVAQRHRSFLTGETHFRSLFEHLPLKYSVFHTIRFMGSTCGCLLSPFSCARYCCSLLEPSFSSPSSNAVAQDSAQASEPSL